MVLGNTRKGLQDKPGPDIVHHPSSIFTTKLAQNTVNFRGEALVQLERQTNRVEALTKKMSVGAYIQQLARKPGLSSNQSYVINDFR